MKYSDELFQLIKSLSKQEKSYFKKFASAFSERESNNYLKLFDEIVRQSAKDSDYDESKIKEKQFKGKFVKNISYHKNYLYNMILNSLTQYHRDSDMLNIRNLISQSEILFDKILYSQCKKVLMRAKALAVEKELFSNLIEILLREKLINKFTLSINEFSSANEIINKELSSALNKLKNNFDYISLNDWFMEKVHVMGSAFAREEKVISLIDRFFQNELLTDESKANTFHSRNLLYGLKAHHALLKKDFEEMYRYNTKLVELWEENIHRLSKKIDNYLIALTNLMNSQIRLNKFEEFDKTSGKMESLKKTHAKSLKEKDLMLIFYSLSIMKFSKFVGLREFDKLNHHTEAVESQLKSLEFKITLQQRIILYYYVGMYNFVFCKYEECIFWMGKIINSEKSDLSENYQCFARIIHLLSYFELGYFDSLEYTLKSTYHFLKKRERVYKYENIILKYLRKSFRIKSDKELIEMFSDMKTEMEKIYNEPFEQNAFDIFNILFWLESKVKKISLLDVMKMS